MRQNSPGKAVVDVPYMLVVCYSQAFKGWCQWLAEVFERLELWAKFNIAVEDDVEECKTGACVVNHLWCSW